MAKLPVWELEDLYKEAQEKLKALEEEYKYATFAEKENLGAIKDNLLYQRKHVKDLAKIRNEFNRNIILDKANGIQKRKAAITACAAVPAVIGAVKASIPYAQKLIKIILP